MPKATSPRKPKPKRQPNGEGSPEILPSGLIRYKGQWNGQKVSGSARKTYEEAKAAYREKIHELENPVVVEPTKPAMLTVEDYMWQVLDIPWRARLKHKTLAPSTWQMAEQVWRLNVKGSPLGKLTLDQVVPRHLEDWCSGLMTQRRVTKAGKVFPSRPVGNNSKIRYMGLMQSVFEEAVDKEKLLLVNPCVKALRPEPDEVDFRILNDREVEELLLLCDKEDPNETNIEKEKRRRLASNHRRRKICLIMLHGYGPAEACGSRYEDFDGEGIFASRQRQRLRHVGVVERDRLKTKARKAWVAVDDELAALFREKDKGWFLDTERGTPMEPANLRRCFHGMVKGTKFEGMDPYDLRHTFAMRLLEEGVDVKTAAELMRHSVEVFLRRYVKSDRARKIAAIRKMQEARERVNSARMREAIEGA